jgi:S-adenosylmethionine:tRNA ribosyltransferase-isomerase
MEKSDFSFELPDELIAQYPLAERSASRLLVCHRHSHHLEDQVFSNLAANLRPGDLVVFNNTRVIPARLFGSKESGGKVEIMLERILDDHHFIAMLRCSKKPQIGQKIVLDGGESVIYDGREGEFFQFSYRAGNIHDLFNRYGQMPLPPYIQRQPDKSDEDRYQTIFANKPGAVAAPTASLHFDSKVLQSLESRGVKTAEITLHVGAGTFQPVRTENIEQHVMHAEYLEIPQQVVDIVQATKREGGRVFAAGTTSLRALEAASAHGELETMAGETRLFIRPGYHFKTVDGLITNFHLPESTLLMLVSAFAGVDEIRHCYQHAVDEKYRFFSYGDAMLILPGEASNEI